MSIKPFKNTNEFVKFLKHLNKYDKAVINGVIKDNLCKDCANYNIGDGVDDLRGCYKCPNDRRVI
ncbi:hypothetical protein [Clostridium perfringens]|uniref:hypothetical protein n=1 Tax=Clostridium perfringens TaxID=1502 RepID=UPI0032DB10B6